MKHCIVELLIAILSCSFKARVVCIPLQQFLPFGEQAGDVNATFFSLHEGALVRDHNDGASRPIPVNPPYTIAGKQKTSLHVNVNGVISMGGHRFPEFVPQPFPYNTSEDAIICPFWDDVNIQYEGTIYHNNGSSSELTRSRVTQLIQESLDIRFNPTGVFVATWVRVSLHFVGPFARIFGKNTFQCVLATNGQDTFVLFLYADGLIQWARGFSLGDFAQVGVDGGDGVNYYSIPNSLTPKIINITHTSNVNTPGLWILKVDSNIIAGLPMAPSDVEVAKVGATKVTLRWTHSTVNAAETFTIACTDSTDHTISTVITNPEPNAEPDSDPDSDFRNGTLSFVYPITGLEEYTSYTCSITPRNVFGAGPPSETIGITTKSNTPSGSPMSIQVVTVSSSTFHLEWSPPSEEDRYGLITGYRILLDWDMGQELRAATTHTNYTFTGLQQDTDYYYRIAAETSAGTGPFSSRSLVRTLKDKDTDTAEQKGPSVGVIGGAGGAAILLIVLITATCVALCVVVKCKTKKEVNLRHQNVVSTKDDEVNIYDEVDQVPNIALKPTTSRPAPRQRSLTTAAPPKHYTFDSDGYYKPKDLKPRSYNVPADSSTVEYYEPQEQKSNPYNVPTSDSSGHYEEIKSSPYKTPSSSSGRQELKPATYSTPTANSNRHHHEPHKLKPAPYNIPTANSNRHYYEPKELKPGPYKEPRKCSQYAVPQSQCTQARDKNNNSKLTTLPKPKKTLPCNEQEPSRAGGVYTSLNPDSMDSCRDPEYTPLSDATRRDDPEYVNCKSALGKSWAPKETTATL